MNSAALWEELTVSATLGTERRSATLPAAADPLGAALAALDTADQPGALLSAAALLAQYQRAGTLPAPTSAAPEAAAPDPRPACSRQAAEHLRTLLGGQQRALLPEWLDALHHAGLQLPPILLPTLFDLGAAQEPLRPAITAALGPRGRWLAAQNPDWRYAVDPTDRPPSQETWETAGRAERRILLGQLRGSDPAAARALLEAAWPTERADERAALLGTLRAGLSLADEPLLETALDDRGKEVRRIAAGLLSALPGSALTARMTERAAALLRWVPASAGRLLGIVGGKPAQIAVTLPAACDPPLVRDGVEPQLPGHRRTYGERAWWLMQILAAIPPATWSTAWNAPPDAIVAAAARSEWQRPLLDGLALAAERQRDPVWAAALLQHAPERAELLELLEPDQQERLLRQILRGDCLPLDEHPVLLLLQRTGHQWSNELASDVLRTIYQHVRTSASARDYALRTALTEEFARRIPPDFAAQIASGWPRDPAARERWHGPLEGLLITLQFRQEMLAALGTR